MAQEHDLHLGVKANVNDAQKQIEKLVNHISKLENEVKKAGKSNLNNLNRSLQQTASISSQLKSGFGKFTDSLSQLPGVVGSATTGIRSFIAASGTIALVTAAVTGLIKVFDPPHMWRDRCLKQKHADSRKAWYYVTTTL